MFRTSPTTMTLWAVVLTVCGLPLAWTAVGLLTTPAAWGQLAAGHVWAVHAGTIAYALAAAAVATAASVGPAAVLARGGVVTLALAAATLAVPEAAWAYGWAEALRMTAGVATPDSWADRARAVVTTAAQVWPVPAGAVAVAWSRLPADVLEQADLDGGRRRVTLALLLPAAAAGFAGAVLLAGRQTTAYDQSGIVTSGVLAREAYVVALGGVDRAAAAAASAMPAMLAFAAVGIIGLQVWVRRSCGPTGRSLIRRPTAARWPAATGMVPVLLLVAVPFVALLRTAGPGVLLAYADLGPQLRAGVGLAALATLACGGMLLLATIARGRGVIAVAVAAFLAGGQLVALGLLHALNRPLPQPWAAVQDVVYEVMYDRPPAHAWPAAALFAWLPLAAAGATWRGGLLGLRRQASLDGANARQTAAYVVWPLAWPGLLASLAAVFALALAETPAAVLMFPGSIVNTMMTNVHTLAYDAMARAAILGAVACGGVMAAAAVAWKMTEGRGKEGGGRKHRSRRLFLILALLLPPSSLLPSGCDRPPPPQAVWSSVGSGEGQVVYPRGAVYSEADDAVWVVDRNARVQKLRAADGSFVLGWRMPDWRYGKPVGLGVDGEGNLYVPDTHYGRVIVYSPDGEELYRFGGSGEGPGQFVWPTDVVVLDDGRVLVSEYGAGPSGNNDRVQIFRREDGEMRVVGEIGSFGTGPGEFRRPQSMAVVGETLWVADAAGHRLLAYDLETGAYERSIGDGGASDLPGRFRFPYGLAVDGGGNLIVTEFGNNRVQVVDPATGESLATWGRFGGRPGELKYPWAAAYDARRGRAVVVDSGNDRLQVIRPPAIAAAPGSKF